MELAAEKLEALVNQAEVTLNSILLKIEEDLTIKAGVQLRPVYVVCTIQELQNELQELKKQSEALIQMQDDYKNQLSQELQVSCKKIQALQNKTGCESVHSNTVGSALKTHFDKLNIE